MDEEVRVYSPGRSPRIVAIGGGHGLSTMLRGLKRYARDITAIVTMADDGGGSGMLRQDLGMLPPGDARDCVLALANTDEVMEQLMTYRFSEGSLTGQNFGNLLLAALNGICGSFAEAVRAMGEVLAVTGRVLPVTEQDIHLQAQFDDGSTVLGESAIFYHKKESRKGIRRVVLTPEHPKAYPESLRAYKLMIMNLMTQDGETEGYTAADHVRELTRHSGPGVVDACLANLCPVPEHLREEYVREGAGEIELDWEEIEKLGVKLFTAPLLSDSSEYARHDPDLLAKAILELWRKEGRRIVNSRR